MNTVATLLSALYVACQWCSDVEQDMKLKERWSKFTKVMLN